jgi:hypothetical protein
VFELEPPLRCSSCCRTKPDTMVIAARNNSADKTNRKVGLHNDRYGTTISSSSFTVDGPRTTLLVGLMVTWATPELWTTTKGGTGLGGDLLVVSYV